MTHGRGTARQVDYNAWHELMITAGWVAVYESGNVVKYERQRPSGNPLVVDQTEFAQWAGLKQTPPPF